MNSVNCVNAEIISLAKQFHLSILSGGKFSPSYENGEECILEVLRAEADAREKRAIAERAKQARLPTYKGFKEFDTDFQKGITREQLTTLESLEWVDQAFNLVMIGPPGTGKTHIALAVGNKAVEMGYKVFFSPMDILLCTSSKRGKSQLKARRGFVGSINATLLLLTKWDTCQSQRPKLIYFFRSFHNCMKWLRW